MIKKLRNYYQKWVYYKQELKAKSILKYQLVDLTETIISALIMALIIRQFVLQTSKVFSGSMIPTMQIDDRLFVNKVIYHFRNPKRGEIVLFDSPYKDGKQFVKRLVGLPGEKLTVKRGIIYINDQAITFPGVNVQRDFSYFKEVTIPADSFFMMGDNRGNSADSRYFGFVHKDHLIGKAIFTFWPLNRMQVLH